jgi:hypothetical protein
MVEVVRQGDAGADARTFSVATDNEINGRTLEK